MSKRPKKQYDDDDGRVIAPMNVDGMPWYDRSLAAAPKKAPKEKVEGQADGAEDEVDYKSLSPAEKKEYRKETNAIIRGIIRQFMPYLLLFVGAGAVVVLILWLVWK